ncbi:hypothetical protein AB1Y20_001625 [Prymnesium parvum]|uniref:inosine/xanthosine triphosphatase n=1 Tax=Prymnesium parvum TaxID=97485 RepID=A0AB34KCK0_PRYPA
MPRSPAAIGVLCVGVPAVLYVAAGTATWGRQLELLIRKGCSLWQRLVSRRQPLRVVLGSTNTGKIAACQHGFVEASFFQVVVSGIAAPSSVSDQPMGVEETILGAKNRAVAALLSDDSAQLGVGLESGLVLVGEHCLDICACAIYTGASHYVGLSSSWMLPPDIAGAIAERGYNQAFEDSGFSADDTGDGVLAQLSNGLLSRPSQMQESVRAALVSLNASLSKPELYPEPKRASDSLKS